MARAAELIAAVGFSGGGCGRTIATGGRASIGVGLGIENRQRYVTSDPPSPSDRGVALPPPPAHHSHPPKALPGQVFTSFWLRLAPGATRFMLVGELDLVTAGRAREALRHAQAETRSLICDLGDVWFVDLSGLRVLLDAAAQARGTGCQLTIANCPPIVPRMLELLELEDALDIQATPAAAPPHGWSAPWHTWPAPQELC